MTPKALYAGAYIRLWLLTEQEIHIKVPIAAN